MWNPRRIVQIAGVALIGIGTLTDLYLAKGTGMYIGCPGVFLLLASLFLPKAKDTKGTGRMNVHALPKKELAALPESDRDTLGALYEKTQRDYITIEQTLPSLRDPAFADELAALQPIAVRIMDYMERHPEKIALARKFVTYYQDRTAALAKEYLELERTGVETPQVEATKAKIRQTLQTMDEAYTAEFEKLLADKLLDVDAELKVMEQTLAADGIEDKGRAAAPEGGESGSFVDLTKHPKPDESFHPTGPRSWSERLADRAKQAAEEEKARAEGKIAPWQGRPQLGRAHRGAIVRREGSDLAIIPPPLYDDVRRQRIVMSVLSILLGTFGAHRFYQGRIGLGILYVIACGTGIPTILSLCEGIRYATMPLARFYEKYYRPLG